MEIIKVESCKECPYHRTIELDVKCPMCEYEGYETCSYKGNHGLGNKIGQFPKKIPKWCPLKGGKNEGKEMETHARN